MHCIALRCTVISYSTQDYICCLEFTFSVDVKSISKPVCQSPYLFPLEKVNRFGVYKRKGIFLIRLSPFYDLMAGIKFLWSIMF